MSDLIPKAIRYQMYTDEIARLADDIGARRTARSPRKTSSLGTDRAGRRFMQRRAARLHHGRQRGRSSARGSKPEPVNVVM
jgi:hypothetical protein